jgi:uncharacterized protein YndB with AHSA1/START domain
MSDKPTFVYVTYIESTAEKVWHALTDADLTGQYWGHSNVSDWQVGSRWEHQRTDGTGIADVVGTVVESVVPTRLVTTWAAPDGDSSGEPSRVTFDIEPYGGMVRLTVTHVNLTDEAEREAAAAGWSAVLSNLKSLLEAGHVLPHEPWKMPRRVTAATAGKSTSRRGPAGSGNVPVRPLSAGTTHPLRSRRVNVDQEGQHGRQTSGRAVGR